VLQNLKKEKNQGWFGGIFSSNEVALDTSKRGSRGNALPNSLRSKVY